MRVNFFNDPILAHFQRWFHCYYSHEKLKRDNLKDFCLDWFPGFSMNFIWFFCWFLTRYVQEKSKESTINDLKKRAELRKNDHMIKRVNSMPNGGNSMARSARENILAKLGEDPTKSWVFPKIGPLIRSNYSEKLNWLDQTLLPLVVRPVSNHYC